MNKQYLVGKVVVRMNTANPSLPKSDFANEAGIHARVLKQFDDFEKLYGRDKDVMLFPYRYPVETINRVLNYGNYFPIDSLHIETTTRCNLKCPGCFRTGNEYDSKNRSMTMCDFERIVDSLPPVKNIGLQGIGESTMNRDLPAMVRYAKENTKAKLSIITNALAKPLEYYEELFEIGLDNIVISVDSLNQETSNRLRTGTNVDRLKDNIIFLADKYPKKISLNTVVSKINEKEIGDLFLELIETGMHKNFLSHQLQPLIDPPNYTNSEMSASDQRCFYESMKEQIRGYYKKIDYNIKLHFHFVRPNIPCIQAFGTSYFTVDSHLTPCCSIVDKNDYSFGNLSGGNFSNSYLSENALNFRKQILHGIYPQACKGCPSNQTENDG